MSLLAGANDLFILYLVRYNEELFIVVLSKLGIGEKSGESSTNKWRSSRTKIKKDLWIK